MRILRALKWKFDYAMTMRRDVQMGFFEGWRWANIALQESPNLHDEMDGDDAAVEELSCWHD